GSSHQIGQPPVGVPQIAEGQPDVALALVSRVVYGYQQSLAAGALPGKCQDAIPRPVPLPGGYAGEQLPRAVTYFRPSKDSQETVVELGQSGIDGLIRAPAEVRRNALLASPKLPLVKEAQARGQEGDDGGGLMNPRRKSGGGPWLVVVLQEAGHPVLVIQPRVEMFADGPDVPVAEAGGEPLVVGVIETLVVQGPLQVPVHFGHEGEAGNALADTLRCPGPEERSALAPGSLEDVGQDQHGHVAADAVALAGDLHQFAEHCLLGGGVGVVELKR